MKSTFKYAVILLASIANIALADEIINADERFSQLKSKLTLIQWHTILNSDSWGYTVETILTKPDSKEQQRIQSYDPSRTAAKQWQLLEQDYTKPSNSSLIEYEKTQASLADEESLSNGLEIISPDSLRLVSETDEWLTYSFNVRLPMFEDKINRLFIGKLFVLAKDNSIEKLELKASESFSPSMSVKVSQYDMMIDFKSYEDVIHVSEIRSTKAGTFMFFTDFHETHLRKISEYKAVN